MQQLAETKRQGWGLWESQSISVQHCCDHRASVGVLPPQFSVLISTGCGLRLNKENYQAESDLFFFLLYVWSTDVLTSHVAYSAVASATKSPRWKFFLCHSWIPLDFCASPSFIG